LRYLLFPDEERALFRHLRDELGLRPLATGGDITDDFPDLIGPAQRDHYFWCPDIGPIRTLGEAPPPRDAKELVLQQLNRQADPANWRDMIDLARTPVISWHRPSWYRKDTRVVAGRLGSMAARRKEHPPELRRLHGQIDRWLRGPSTKFNPFRHCSGLPVPEPNNLATFWVAAWPLGKAWVQGGGELWPWDA
jgi:hypothetical protein